MQWAGGRRSDNVEDRRGRRAGGGRIAGLGGLGLGGILILALLGYLIGGDPLALLTQVGPMDGGMTAPADPSPREAGLDDAGRAFVSLVLADTEDTWTPLFQQMGRRYPPPRLVLFSDVAESACGTNSSAVGPFYCPGDSQVYIDLAFFRDLDQRFGAPGDFAQAYVIAHEVGHHVQNVLGVFESVRRQSADRASANALSVRQELQADCFAGVWGYYAAKRGRLVEGDLEEGLTAAAAIGDDRIQRQTQGRVSPESWTHGSSVQRVEWFTRGLKTGQVEHCDTFNTR